MKTIALIEPVTLHGKVIETLTMKRPTIGDEEDALALAEDIGKGDNTLSAEMCLFSILCKISYDDLREFPTYVHQELRRAYHQLAMPRVTGKKSGNEEAPEEQNLPESEASQVSS